MREALAERPSTPHPSFLFATGIENSYPIISKDGKDFRVDEMAKTGQMTVVPAYAEQQNAIAPFYATFAEQLKTAKNRLAISSASKVDGILNTELTAAFKGEVSVQDALTKAAGQIDALLAEENS